MESLHEIGLRHNTDKAFYHGYSHLYGELLAPLRRKKITLLELGWGGYGGMAGPGGESARMWVDAFPRAQVYVLDNNPGLSEVPERCELIVGDQADSELLTALADRAGDFDVIVDDASHHGTLTRRSFEILWPRVKPAGWYFIEDVNTSYLDQYGGNPDPAAGGDTAVMLTKHLVDVAQTEGVFAREQTRLLDYLSPIGIDRMVIAGNLVALRKKQ